MERRSIKCEIVEGNVTDKEIFSSILKKDWEERAWEDSSLYVMAESNAKEEEILNSGKHDFFTEIYPRIKEQFTSCSYVLEIGCGIGRLGYYAAETCGEYGEYLGVDISKRLLDIAKVRLDKFDNVYFFENNGYNLEGIGDNSVDIVYEYICFQHIPSEDIIESYIKEIDRVLKKEGIALLHGRDVQGIHTDDNYSGNTWHGCQFGPKLVRRSIESTSLCIISEEGIQTDRYWVTLKKKEKIENE